MTQLRLISIRIIQSIFVIICVFTAFHILSAGAIILDFRGEPGYNKVTLLWKTENELDLKGYEVERGFDDKEFKKVGFVEASNEVKDKKEYTYQDNSVFKQTSRTFYYRLKIVDKDEKTFTYSKEISVTPTISSARQTWGSIKAMFR